MKNVKNTSCTVYKCPDGMWRMRDGESGKPVCSGRGFAFEMDASSEAMKEGYRIFDVDTMSDPEFVASMSATSFHD